MGHSSRTDPYFPVKSDDAEIATSLGSGNPTEVRANSRGRLTPRGMVGAILLLSALGLIGVIGNSRKSADVRPRVARTVAVSKSGVIELDEEGISDNSKSPESLFLNKAMKEAKASIDVPTSREPVDAEPPRTPIGKSAASDQAETVKHEAVPTQDTASAADTAKTAKSGGVTIPVEVAKGKYLKPLESRHDGNLCDTEEELWGGLCYRKCSLLTAGQRHVRKGPWTCCNDLPCDNVQEVAQAGFRNPFSAAKMCLDHCDGKVGSSIICNGYDVARDSSCPHSPGACLTDEELHVGVCYKRCDILTDGAYPFRSAAATCCKEHTEIGCLKIGASSTKPEFEVGGGAGDHDKSTPRSIHMPQEDLTEDIDATTTHATTQAPKQPTTIEEDLKPKEIMNDGNVCGDIEELFDGLCYRKCSLLTDGASPIRTSAWTCCDARPCNFKKVHKGAGLPVLCNGYGISGTGSCPHKPGACLDDEELFMGVCFKKCDLLTGGEFAHRSAAGTCCKSTGLSCLLPSNIRISKDFSVGGGKGDGDPSTPALAHGPLVSLTENTNITSVAKTKQDRAPQGDETEPETDHSTDDDGEWSWFKVVVNGNVNVRRGMSAKSLVINVERPNSLILGRSRGDWVELKDQGGFMMKKFKGLALLAEAKSESA